MSSLADPQFYLGVLVGLLVLAGLIALFYWTIPWTVGPILRLLLLPHYTLRIHGRQHVPRRGPVVLASNHVSWLDGFVMAAAVPRPGKALVNADYMDVPVLGRLAQRAGMMPVPASGPKAQRAVINAVREALDRGEAVLIFPEAQLSRSGWLNPFYRGLEVMVAHHPGVPVVPVFLGGLWGSYFSFSGGHFFRKRPQSWRRSIDIVFGPPIPAPVSAFHVRQAVMEAGVLAAKLQRQRAGQPDRPVDWPEFFDPSLPHWIHPTLGPLAGSGPDFKSAVIHQVASKPGSVGLPPAGVALRVVNPATGEPLPPGTPGRIEALTPQTPGWTDTGATGTIDRDGFIRLDPAPAPAAEAPPADADPCAATPPQTS